MLDHHRRPDPSAHPAANRAAHYHKSYQVSDDFQPDDHSRTDPATHRATHRATTSTARTAPLVADRALPLASATTLSLLGAVLPHVPPRV